MNKTLNIAEWDMHKEGLLEDGFCESPHGNVYYLVIQLSPADDWWCLIKELMGDDSYELFEVPVVSFALCDVVNVDITEVGPGDYKSVDVHRSKEVLPVLQNFAAGLDGTSTLVYIPYFSGDIGEVVRLYRGKGEHNYTEDDK